LADEPVVETGADAPIELRFAFGNADIETVLDVLSRATGLPVVMDTPIPDGTITFKSPDTYDLPNGLRVLNTILQTKGVTVRVDNDVLRLEALKNMQRANLPTFAGTIPDDITDDQLVTVLLGLKAATAEAVVERFAPMVGEYGHLIALPGQNAIVLTEMAGKARRLMQLFEEADQQSPEGQVEVFVIQHVPASTLVKPLTELMSVKVEKYLPDKKGKLKKVEEISLQGVSFSADERTNAIIAKGSRPSLDRMREIIALLDTQSTRGDRELRVLPLALLSVDTAIERLNAVIATLPEGERPVLVPMPEQASIGVTGMPRRVEQIASIVTALEGGAIATGDRVIESITLEKARAEAVLQALNEILPPSSRSQIRMSAGPDGRSLLLAGPAGVVASVRAMVPTLDASTREQADVQVVELQPEGLETVIPQAYELGGEVVADVKVQAADDGTTLVTGPRSSVTRMAELLVKLDAALPVETTVSVFEPMRAHPNTLAANVRALVRAGALGNDAGDVEILPDPSMHAVLVAGRQVDVKAVMALLEDRDQQTALPLTTTLEVHDVRHGDPKVLAGAVSTMLRDRARWPQALRQAVAAGTAVPNPTVIADLDSSRIMINGPSDLMPLARTLLASLDRPASDTGAVETRVVQLERADATNVMNATQAALAAKGRFSPAARRVTVSAEPSSNTIVLTGPVRELDDTMALISSLDEGVSAETNQVRTVYLKYALAERVAPVVESLMGGEQYTLQQRIEAARRRVSLPEARQTVKVAADVRLNAVVIVARPGVLPIAEALVQQLDMKDATTRTASALQVIRVRHADAAELARTLTPLLQVESSIAPPVIQVDRASNSLLVRGDEAQLAMLQSLVEDIDEAALAFGRRLEIVPLDPARVDAAELAATLKRLLDQNTGSSVEVLQLEDLLKKAPLPEKTSSASPLGLLPTLTAIALGADGEPAVSIAVDPTTNSLVLLGGDRAVRRARALLDQLVAQSPSPPGRLRRIELGKHYDAKRLAALMVQALGTMTPQGGKRGDYSKRVVITPDPTGRAILLTCSDHDFKTVTQVLQAMAPAGESTRSEPRTISLKRADAGQVARAIQRLYDDRAKIDRTSNRVTIIGEKGDATLLVSADDDDFLAVKELAERLDSPRQGEAFQIRAFPLVHAKAQDVANTVQDMVMQLAYGSQVLRGWFGRSAQGTMPGRIAVFPDLRLNALVVTGHGETFDVVENVVAVIDAASPEGSTRQVKTYHVSGTSMDTVEAMMGDLYGRNDRWWRQQDETAPVVRLDEVHRVLIVAGNAAQHAEIKQLLDVLDTYAVGDRTIVKTFSLTDARADNVVNVLTSALALDRSGSTSGTVITPADGGDPVEIRARIVADTRSNSLIVTGSPESMPVLEALILELDAVPTVAEVEYHTLVLEHAIAEDVRWSLNQMVMSMDYPRPQIDANRIENQLIIAATSAQYEQLVKLIEQLDQPRTRTRETRFLKLEHAQADKVRQALTVFYGPYAMEADTPSKLSVSIVADPSTNSLVVSAEEREWEGIEALIAELDNEAYDSSLQVRVLPLTHAEAKSVARAINEAFSREVTQRGATRRARKGSGDDRDAEVPTILVQSEEWVSASAEPVTNSVIVAATGRTLERIEAIVASLDQPNTSVDVKVHVITLDASPVARVAKTLAKTFAPRAEQLRVPLSIEHDPMTNSLVVATSAALADEIRETAKQLDSMVPASGHGVTIIELQHIAPPEAIRVIEALGLDKTPRDDAMSRLVNEAVRVTPVTGRNAVMLLSNPADTNTVVDILRALDEPPRGAEGTMQIIPLQHTQASEMADVLREMLNPADQQVGTDLAKALQEQVRRLSVRHGEIGRGLVTLDLTEPIRIVVNPVQNALVVTSTTANVLAVEALVDLLDEVPVVGAAVIRIIPLKNIAATDFRRIVEEVFEGGKELARLPGTDIFGRPTGLLGPALLDHVVLSVDERTNTLVVAGREEAVATVEVLVERLDSDLATGDVEVQVLSLEWADPDDLATTLNKVLVEGATDLPNAGHLQTQVGRLRFNGGDSHIFQPMHELTFVPQGRTESLIVVGSSANIAIVRELVAMLDVEEASPSSTVRLFPLEHATAAQLAGMLDRLLKGQLQSGALDREDSATIQADLRTNTLVVSASNKVFDIVEGLLDRLDTNERLEFQAIRTLKLQHASASRVASLVQRMMDARVERLRVVEPQTWALERVVVIADEPSNSLIVAASVPGFDVIEKMLEDLDRASFINTALVEVIASGGSSAIRLAETIRTVMERRYADVPRQERVRMMPLIQVDTRSDSLLVTASPEDLDAIRDLVDRLDAVPLDPAVGLHVLPVSSGTNAERLAPRIQRLMADRVRSLGTASSPSDAVTVQFESSINSLIVSANDENLLIIEDLLDMLVRAGDGAGDGREIDIIALSAGQADEVVRLLQDLYVKEANRSRGAGTVMVSADRNLNSILVNAPPRDVQEIRELVERLEGTSPADILEIRHIPLSSANAIETVSLIEDVLAGRSIGRRRSGSERSTVLRYVRAAADGSEASEMAITNALRETINLTPDIRTNTVIIRAPADAMKMLVEMIQDLDDTSTGSKSLRVFKLKNADATAMRQILRDLFRLDEGQDLLVLKPRELARSVPGIDPAALAQAAGIVSESGFGTVGFDGGGLGGTELTAVPDPRQQLAITVDTRTNSLLVSGSPAYLDLVAEVVETLDSQESNERETLVYQLRNATAEEVARVLGDFVEEEQRTLIETLGIDQLGSAARMLEREVTIRGDAKSNSVLVSASPRYMQRVMDMIEALDVDPPQVLIQVLLAEVSLEGGVDWGVSFRGGPIGGASDSSGFGLPVGVASPILGALGVPTLALGGSDFSLVLSALEAQERLHILSNPSVMAANNEQATINVGEIIYVAQGAQTFDTGLVSVPLEEKDVGVSLVVTPSINPDGYVRLKVQPTLSKLLAGRDEPAVGVTSPRILQRTADTTITVKDGQTIVIGGLINENYERYEEKVPLLGDIPLLGWLFRSETQVLVRNELVIVITPHIVRSPADLDRVRELTQRETSRMALPKQVLEQLNTGRLQKDSMFIREGGTLRLRETEVEAETQSP
jgi:type II secretion system protein D